MAGKSSIHWEAPTFIVVALLCGIIFSLGHHFFYSSLAGTPAPSSDYDLGVTTVSTQQINIAVGTAFAFLVKFFLVTATTIAYVQLFWRGLLHQANDVTLDSIDCTFSALVDVFTLFKVWIWYRRPLLFLIACVCWLLPLGAIVTPGTLTVESKPRLPPPVSSVQVPTAGFDSLNYLSDMQTSGTPMYWTGQGDPPNPGTYIYEGPSRAIQKVALDVATNGDILQFSPPAVNSTWTVDFAGPALQCSTLQGEERQAILQNVAATTNDTKTVMYTFLAWTYSRDRTAKVLKDDTDLTLSGSTLLPFKNNNFNTTYIHPGSNMPADLYVAAIPCDALGTGQLQNATFTKCSLKNTTYHTEFSFINERQDIQISVDPTQTTPVSAIGAVIGPAATTGLVTYPGTGPECPAGSDVLHEINGTACSFDSTVARTLSYQAAFDAFNQLLVGTVKWSGYMNPVIDTGVVNTMLINSPEMSFVKQMHQRGLATLQKSFRGLNSTLARGFAREDAGSTGQPLREAIESLFQKTVISSMASPQLQSNPESAFAPPPTDVTFHSYHNIYEYSSSRLWISYGIAIFVSAIVCTFGFWVIFVNRASYSFSFSSIFRYAWGASIDKEIREEDTTGQDPLPVYLANAKVSYHGLGSNKERTSVASQVTAASMDSSSSRAPVLPPVAEQDSRTRLTEMV